MLYNERLLGRLFAQNTEDSPQFAVALSLVQPNVSGRMWVIGGFLYQTLAAELYGRERSPCDIDFLVEKYVEVHDPFPWRKVYNRFGNPKYVLGRKSIDIVPLHNVGSIHRKARDFSLESYLLGTPLTVQSLAYEIEAGRVSGEVGMQALHERTVGVHDHEEAHREAKKKKMSIHNLVKSKAESLGFTPQRKVSGPTDMYF